VCTILVRWDPPAPEALVVAANRDEFRDRPTDGPGRFRPGVFAGRDRRAGGTWLAVGARGLAAVTNIAGSPPDPALRSRGALPLAALAGSLPASFEAWNPFNLLVADASGLRVVVHRGGGAPHRIVALEPGAYAIVNEPFGDGVSERARRAARLLETAAPDFALLADHGERGDGGLCHHGDAYGTVSATTIGLDRTLGVARYLHADGLPCRTVPRDRTADARAVVAAALP
jgi:uncharacterized protein with NRDE domain